MIDPRLSGLLFIGVMIVEHTIAWCERCQGMSITTRGRCRRCGQRKES